MAAGIACAQSGAAARTAADIDREHPAQAWPSAFGAHFRWMASPKLLCADKRNTLMVSVISAGRRASDWEHCDQLEGALLQPVRLSQLLHRRAVRV